MHSFIQVYPFQISFDLQLKSFSYMLSYYRFEFEGTTSLLLLLLHAVKFPHLGNVDYLYFYYCSSSIRSEIKIRRFFRSFPAMDWYTYFFLFDKMKFSV